jgi:hypothetical protein
VQPSGRHGKPEEPAGTADNLNRFSRYQITFMRCYRNGMRHTGTTYDE